MHFFNTVKIPDKDERLAEFVGIMLGDGNIYFSEKHGVYQIKITNNSVTDKDYMINFVKPLVESLFGLKASISFDKGRKGMNLRIAGLKLINFLSTLGLVAGDKINNGLRIGDWIKNDSKLLIPCIRGLFDTDGTVFLANKSSSRYVIGFKNNKLLLEDVRNGLVALGFHPTKIIKNAVFVHRKSEIGLFNEIISFSNPKHKIKISPVMIAPSRG